MHIYKNISMNILMKQLKIYLPSALIIWSAVFGGQLLAQTQAFTLEQAIQYAKDHSTAMQMANLDVLDANEQITAYKAIGIPKLSGSVNYQYYINIPTQILPDFLGPAVDGRLLTYNLISSNEVLPASNAGFPAQFGRNNNINAGLNLDMLLVDGSYFLGLKAARLARELAVRQQNVSIRDLENNVTTAYLAVMSAAKNETILLNNISSLEQTYHETRITYENGFIEKMDVDRIQLTLENLKRNLDNIKRYIELSKNLLKFQMAYPLDQEITLSDAFDDLVDAAKATPEWAALSIDYNLRPEYRVLETAHTLAEMDVKRQQLGYYPSLRGFGAAAASLQRNNLFDGQEAGWFPSTYVGVTLNVPIFDGFDRKAKINQAKIALQRNQLQTDFFKQSVSLEVSNARTQYANAHESLEASERNLDLANRILETAKTKFKEGVGTSLEVIQAEREYYEAQANVMNAEYDLVIAKKDWQKALGIN